MPGSRLKRRQRTMRAHMKEPRTMLARQAAVIAVEDTITRLRKGASVSVDMLEKERKPYVRNVNLL